MNQPVTSANTFPWEWPVIAPGPSWNIPRISLPSCLGPLLQYQQEWWYYAGYARDAGGNNYSLQFSINRMPLSGADPLFQVIACMTGIGDAATNNYFFNTAFNMGISTDPSIPLGLTIPAVTNTSYDISTKPLIGTAKTRIHLTGGQAGVAGSTYQLSSSSTSPAASAYEAELQLLDERGMILEWQSGFIGPDSPSQFDSSSFEFAQPRLRIQSGSLVLEGTTRVITEGMLWLDRQVVTNPPASSSVSAITTSAKKSFTSQELLANLISNPGMKSLYQGSWMGITLNNGATMVCACFWQDPPKGKLQWRTGTLLGLPPKATYGNLYFPLERNLRRMPNGGSYLRGIEKGDPEPYAFDFDVNILYPDKPNDSPHWQSPVLNRATYSNGWWVRVDPKWESQGLPPNLYIKALVSGCENVLPAVALPLTAYWEGAAMVYADKELTQVIGHAFVEQMGFN
jgi:hypothetical protein